MYEISCIAISFCLYLWGSLLFISKLRTVHFWVEGNAFAWDFVVVKKICLNISWEPLFELQFVGSHLQWLCIKNHLSVCVWVCVFLWVSVWMRMNTSECEFEWICTVLCEDMQSFLGHVSSSTTRRQRLQQTKKQPLTDRPITD